MANYNDVLVDPENFVAANKVCLDPTTILTPPPLFTVPAVDRMTVANGNVVQVYDVTNPSNPVLIGTIG